MTCIAYPELAGGTEMNRVIRLSPRNYDPTASCQKEGSYTIFWMHVRSLELQQRILLGFVSFSMLAHLPCMIALFLGIILDFAFEALNCLFSIESLVHTEETRPKTP